MSSSGNAGGADRPVPANDRERIGLSGSDPTNVGPYRLLRRLGVGGMGTVYLGVDRSGRQVAVKLVRSDLARLAEFRDRFKREADSARRVARFCTAAVLDVDVSADVPYLVTEYVDGPTLAEAVSGRGPLSPAELHQLAASMATALMAIHRAGIIHRDLKPGNILLSRLGPKVIDFGIARAFDATSLLSGDRQIGTPAFMAPEQALGDAITSAADVFAWGGVLVYAGTGRYPFGGGPAVTLLYRTVNDDPQLDGFESSLRPLVEQAMRKTPGERPSAEQLYARLLDLRVDDETPAVNLPLSEVTALIRPITPPTPATGATEAAGASAAQADDEYGPAGPITPVTGWQPVSPPPNLGALTSPPSPVRGRGAAPPGRVDVDLPTEVASPQPRPTSAATSGAAPGPPGPTAASGTASRGGLPGAGGFADALETLRPEAAGPDGGPSRSGSDAPVPGDRRDDGPGGRARPGQQASDGRRAPSAARTAAAPAAPDSPAATPSPAPDRGGRGPRRGGRGRGVGVLAVIAAAVVATVVLVVVLNNRGGTNPTGIPEQVAAKALRTQSQDRPLARRLALAAYRVSPDSTLARNAVIGLFAGDVTPMSISLGNRALAAAVSPDGHLLAVGTDAGTIELWDLTDIGNPDRAGTISDAGDWVYSVAFNPGGNVLAAGMGDGAVRLWDVADPTTADKLDSVAFHTDRVRSVAFTPDGNTLASGSDDGRVALWAVTDPSHISPRSAADSSTAGVRALAFSPKGGLLAIGGQDGTVRLWDVLDASQPREHPTLRGHSRTVQAVAFSIDGATLATGSIDGSVHLWTVSNPGSAVDLGGTSGGVGGVTSVGFSTNRTLLASGSEDETVRLIDVSAPSNPVVLTDLRGHTRAVNAVMFTPDGTIVVSASSDGSVRLWNVDAGALSQRACADPADRITQAEWSDNFEDMPFAPPCG